MDTNFLISNQVTKELEKKINNYLQKTGIFYRLWVRTKKNESINRKIENRNSKGILNYKIQDLFGCRVVCYFEEDIPICEKIMCMFFSEIEKDRSIDELDSETFKPIRRNYVYKLPSDIVDLLDDELWKSPVDKTFECQFRSVFSEGWHEVEHDLRYKSQEIWRDQSVLSRKLNAILATVETSEWALTQIFEDLAYSCYKKSNWESMIRTKIRIRFKEDDSLNPKIADILNANKSIAKKLLSIDKLKLMIALTQTIIPLCMDNILYLSNLLFINDENLLRITPELIKEQFNRLKTV